MNQFNPDNVKQIVSLLHQLDNELTQSEIDVVEKWLLEFKNSHRILDLYLKTIFIIHSVGHMDNFSMTNFYKGISQVFANRLNCMIPDMQEAYDQKNQKFH